MHRCVLNYNLCASLRAVGFACLCLCFVCAATAVPPFALHVCVSVVCMSASPCSDCSDTEWLRPVRHCVQGFNGGAGPFSCPRPHLLCCSRLCARCVPFATPSACERAQFARLRVRPHIDCFCPSEHPLTHAHTHAHPYAHTSTGPAGVPPPALAPAPAAAPSAMPTDPASQQAWVERCFNHFSAMVKSSLSQPGEPSAAVGYVAKTTQGLGVCVLCAF